jgi:RNA polymerase sigma-70 factor (ECF subfamily)
MNDLPEAELLAQCRRGQPEAWDELFKRHYAAAGRFVFQLAADFTREDVEEICQETFLAVIRSLDTFKGTSAFQTWLFRVAANKARDHRERQRAAKRGGGQAPLSLDVEDTESGLTLDPPSPLPAPDQLLQREENLRLLIGAVERLEDPCREIVQLRYFGDLSYEEIAATLSLNVKTVSSRLSKCLDRLEALARAIFSGEKPAPMPSNSQTA